MLLGTTQQEIAASRALLEELLGESVEAARKREAATFADLVGGRPGQIVFFGAGKLGRRCLEGCRRSGLQILALTDNNEALWGQLIDGVPVLSPPQAAQQFGRTAVFVVTIWGAFGKDRMGDRMRRLHDLGCERVIPFGPLFWKFPQGVLPHYAADLPHRVLEQKTAIMQCFDLWADLLSRQEYIAQLKWRLNFDFTAMSEPRREQIYFPPDLIELSSEETFVDCGAYNGDTLAAFLQRSQNRFQKFVAIEPDPLSFRNLAAFVSGLPEMTRNRIEIGQFCVGSDRGKVLFRAEGLPSSAVGSGDLEVECVTLHEYLADVRPTFIKMDIEGSEPGALLGGSRVIREQTPTLAISCYHAQEHLWTIPLLIHSLSPRYKLFLRPHDLEGWDLVCYAIPSLRHPGDT